MDVQAVESFDPQGQNQMMLRPGDLIRILVQHSSGWSFGVNLSSRSGVRGWIPSDSVAPTKLEAKGDENRIMQASYAYDPLGPHEMMVRPNDMIQVLEEHLFGWSFCLNLSSRNCLTGWVPTWIIQQQHMESKALHTSSSYSISNSSTSDTFLCPICCDNCLVDEAFLPHPRSSNLTCTVCKSCARQSFIADITNTQFPISCPICAAEIRETEALDPEVVCFVLSETEEDLFHRLSWQHANPKARHCPAIDCNGFSFVDSTGRCSCEVCHTKWCGLCATQHEPQQPCNAQDPKLNEVAQGSGFKRCPSCLHMIGKEEGCNHITCRCQHEFCYVCGVSLDHSNGRTHFRGPGRCPLFGSNSEEETDDDSESNYSEEPVRIIVFHHPIQQQQHHRFIELLEEPTHLLHDLLEDADHIIDLMEAFLMHRLSGLLECWQARREKLLRHYQIPNFIELYQHCEKPAFSSSYPHNSKQERDQKQHSHQHKKYKEHKQQLRLQQKKHQQNLRWQVRQRQFGPKLQLLR